LTSFRLRGPIAGGVAALLAACIGFAALIAMRNYRAARSEIEADPPSPILKNIQSVGLPDLQSVSFTSSQGLRIAGWYVPSKNRAAVIVMHGTNSDRSTMLPELRILAAAGFGVLAFDWPGLGESQGPIVWGDAARGALGSAIDWVGSKGDVDRNRIGGLGFSMGGFILAQVAAINPKLRAVVLESAPSSYDAYLDAHFSKWRSLSKWAARRALRDSDLFSPGRSPVQLIGGISPRPLLIIGQSEDPEIIASMTRALYAAAREPKTLWLIEGDQHGGYDQIAGDVYARRLQTFFTEGLLGP
jgi:uncharacterized protein